MTGNDRKPTAFDTGNSEAPKPASSKAAPAKEEEPQSIEKPKARTKRAPVALAAPELHDDDVIDGKALVAARAPERSLARAYRWLPVLMSSVLALAGLWAGVAITDFVERLFSRNEILGWIGVGLMSLAGLALLAIIIREIAGIWRLKRLGSVQRDAAEAVERNDAKTAASVITALGNIYGSRRDLTWGMAKLKERQGDIIDPADRIRLAERDLVAPLDAEACRIIARTARRVALVTAVTPAAALDIALVAAQTLGMLRELATLYGGRPGTLGTMRLARMVVSHLAVAGGLALTDGLVQQLVGKGILGRVSSRFGEGAINGLLSARIGLAAIDLCRPLPFLEADRPGMADFMREIVGTTAPEDADPKT